MMIENCLKCMLTFGFDFIFANFLICNLVCVVWRIIWDTQDLYLKSNLLLNSIISILIYFACMLVIKYEQIQSIQKDKTEHGCSAKVKRGGPRPNWKKKFKLKMFLLLFSFAIINHWRGIWNFTVFYTNESVMGIFTVGAVSFLGLIAMKRMCILTTAPFLLDKDSKKTAFKLDTNSRNLIYNLSLDQELNENTISWWMMSETCKEYLSDLFGIQAWRSLWYLEDKYIYPENSITSASISLLIGLLIYAILYIFNEKLNKFISSNCEINPVDYSSQTQSTNESNRLTRTSKLIFNVTFILSFISTVNVWRGFWMLQLDFCYPVLIESPILNQMALNLVYMILSLIVFWYLDMTSALLSRSNVQDSFFTVEGNCVITKKNFKLLKQKKCKFSTDRFSTDYKNEKWVKLLEYKLFSLGCLNDKKKEFKMANLIGQERNIKLLSESLV